MDSPSRLSPAPPSSQRGKRSRDAASSSQHVPKRQSAQASAIRAQTTDATALPREPLPAPTAREPSGSKEEREAKGGEEAGAEAEADDDWGSLPVEEDEQHSNSQAEEEEQDSSSHSSDAQRSESPSTAAPASISRSRADSDAEAQSALSTSTSNPSVFKHGVASRMALMRLQSDLKALDADPPEGISASPVDAGTPLVWRACIFGPSDTPWEGGVFQLQLTFPKEYPQKPPHVRFLSKLFHPNVFPDGNICQWRATSHAQHSHTPRNTVHGLSLLLHSTPLAALSTSGLDILAEKWSPIYTVSSLLSSIQSLLTDPNNASPANPDAAKLLANDIKEYRKRVRECAAKATM